MRRWAETVAAGILLALAAAPFVVLFPEPPAFGRDAAAIVAAIAILAAAGASVRAAQPARRRILGCAALLLAVTAGSVAVHAALSRTLAGWVPTLGILPAVFGLEGEDIDDALIYEGWLEVWLCCALATALALALGLRRAARRRERIRPAGPVAPPPASELQRAAPLNGATVLLCLIGCAVLGGAVLDGRQRADFLSRATHVAGTIIDPQPHPRIRFTAADGSVVEFTQNGWVDRARGAAVPVAYLAADPAGSARADTFWADWSDVLILLGIGLCFTLGPFYGMRATVRTRRW